MNALFNEISITFLVRNKNYSQNVLTFIMVWGNLNGKSVKNY